MTERIDIAMGFDSRYAPHAAAVIASLVRRAPGGVFRFIIIHDGVPEARRIQVEGVAPGSDFVWTQVVDEELPPFEYGHLNRAILFRLGLEKLGPTDCRRILYIDADTIVVDDVRKLAVVNLGAHAIGAVRDRYVDAADFARRWSLSSEAPRYFNSGVLVIDLERVREQRLFSAAADFVARHGPAKLPYGDQDALNYVAWDRWCELDPLWNVQGHLTQEQIGAGHKPAIVHFVGLEKPWRRDIWHPWAWLYWQSLGRTPFAAEVAQANGMNFYQRVRLRAKWWLQRLKAVAPR